MVYSALSVGKQTPKIASFFWDCVIPTEEDRVTAIDNVHKNLVKIVRVVQEICSQTNRHTDRQAHTQTCLLQYFATAPAGEVTTNNKETINGVVDMYLFKLTSMCQ